MDGLLDRAQFHPGLAFERFPRYFSEIDDPGARFDWLSEFAASCASDPARLGLQRLHERAKVLLDLREGEERVFTTVWRLATGLGNPSATQVGCTFEWGCGAPCLAGSSVKGLARAGAALGSADAGAVDELLGMPPVPGRRSTGNSGRLIFLDALPLEWPELEVDVITRHHDPERLSSADPHLQPPLDADEPNPVHFLTVAPATPFAFRILPRQPLRPDALELAWGWLEVALEELGAGAKTAVGYGQMLPGAHAASSTSAAVGERRPPSAEEQKALEEFLAFFGDGARFVTEKMSEKGTVQAELVERLRALQRDHPGAFARAAGRVREALPSNKTRSRALTSLLQEAP